jgi:heterodisulfide reductase subunit B
VFGRLGVELRELEDWNCCGASSAHSLSRELALALPARNIAIAQEVGLDVVMPCAACYSRHKAADHALRTGNGQRRRIEQVAGFTYSGSVGIRPLLDVVCTDIGLESVKAAVAHPLNGMALVPYYGCLLVRPPEIARFDDPENPRLMGDLLSALGAEVRPWSYATECCGGGLSITTPKVAGQLVRRLGERAVEAGATAIVTSCPLCQVNLEMRQAGARLPVFYFTELMGVAFGLADARRWWPKHLIDPKPLLKKAGLLV